MHQALVDEVVKRCRQRQAEGDCPTVPAYSTEWLEDAVCALAPKARSSEADDLVARLTAERDGEREAREKIEAAYRGKDVAMQVLFDRLRKAGVDYSDLVP